jgi:hypothetical protein
MAPQSPPLGKRGRRSAVSNADLLLLFPDLASDRWRVTSPFDESYNCIAWAAHDILRLWWPDEDGAGYWPIEKREVTPENFIEAFAALGYERCESGEYENGYEKLALYLEGEEPTHMARQLSTAEWTSKLGNLEDIAHASVKSLEGSYHSQSYGKVHCFLKRWVAP